MSAALAVVLALACVAGAAATIMQIVESGLFGERPPLPAFQTAVRVAAGVIGIALLAVRRDLLERVTIVCAVMATGSSALFGIGVGSAALSASRLIFHLAAYALGAIVLGRLAARPFRLRQVPPAL